MIMLLVWGAPIIYATQYVITYGLKQGIAKFGGAAKQKEAMKETSQLHDRVYFMPIDIITISATKRKHVQDSLLFLTEMKTAWP